MRLRNLIQPDGCSFFPDGNYTSCCNAHDMAYIFGSSRSKADRELRECIIRCNRSITAWIVWIGVRLFGYPFWWIAHRKVRILRAKKKREKELLSAQLPSDLPPNLH